MEYHVHSGVSDRCNCRIFANAKVECPCTIFARAKVECFCAWDRKRTGCASELILDDNIINRASRSKWIIMDYWTSQENQSKRPLLKVMRWFLCILDFMFHADAARFGCAFAFLYLQLTLFAISASSILLMVEYSFASHSESN